MRRLGYDSDDTEFAAAIAASAHAIHSLEDITSRIQITTPNTRKQDSFNWPPQPGSTRKTYSRRDAKSSSSLKPALSYPEDQRWKEASRTLTNTSHYSKADAWENSQIAKIRKRYEKVHSEIEAWEKEKKLREKQKMERKKHEMEMRRSRNLKHYQSKIGRIDNVGKGAKAQLEEKRKHQELIVKERARNMRLTGNATTPVTCYCF